MAAGIETHGCPSRQEPRLAVSARSLRPRHFDSNPPAAPPKVYLTLMLGSGQPRNMHGDQAAQRSTAWAVCVSVPLAFEDYQISSKVLVMEENAYLRTLPSILVTIKAGLMSLNRFTTDLMRHQ